MRNTFRVISILIISFLTSFNSLFSKVGLFILFVLVCFYCMYYIINLSHHKKKVKTGRLYIFFIIWLIYAAIQMIWIEHTPRTFLHFQVIVCGLLLIWFMSRIIVSAVMLETLYKTWGISLLFMITLGWWEILTDTHLTNLAQDFGNVATVTFYNPNNYSFLLVVSLPIILYWIERFGMFYKVLGLFMLISIFYLTYNNGSRLSLLAFIIAISVFLIRLGKSRKKMLLFFISILAIGGGYNYDIISGSIEKILTIDLSDASLNERGYLSESALHIFFGHPFGVGPGGLESFMPIVGLNVHNFWLEILVNYGFIVLAGIILFFGFFIYKLYSIRQSEELSTLIMPVLWSALIFIPTSIAPSSIFTFSITWFLFGVMICTINVIRNYDPKKEIF